MRFKWTPETEQNLVEIVGPASNGQVLQSQLHTVAEQIGTSARSVGSKLRKMGYDVQKASEVPAVSAWTEEATAGLVTFLNENSGRFTYAEIASTLGVDARSVQGKILSLEMTGYVAPTPAKGYVSEFTDEQTATIVEMAGTGASLEAIAAAIGVDEKKVRGKCLALFRAEQIANVPTKENRVSRPDALSGIDVEHMTVAEIAEAIEKTERSVKSMLTRRRLTASDYDGAAKAEKAEARRAQ